MATTKKNETAETTVENTTETTVENTERVRVKLPRLSGHNANQDEFFSVNFKNYIIKRGEYVDIPKELEEVIRNGEKAEDAAFEFAEAHKVREA